MGQIMLNAIKIKGLTELQIAEAYNYFYDDFGYEVNFWEEEYFIKEVKNYWKIKNGK